jgi:hypothetical protein
MALQARHQPPAWIAVLVVPVVVAIALSTFTWSAANLEPRDLPLGVAGTAQATAPLEAKLAQQEGAFEVHRYADEAAAIKAIEDREIYGAMVVAPDGQKLLTAPAEALRSPTCSSKTSPGRGRRYRRSCRPTPTIRAAPGSPPSACRSCLRASSPG